VTLLWVRSEPRTRYHAILARQIGEAPAGDGYLTYCGRRVRDRDVRDGPELDPPARCACCRGRLARPYLIPDHLKGPHDAQATRTA